MTGSLVDLSKEFKNGYKWADLTSFIEEEDSYGGFWGGFWRPCWHSKSIKIEEHLVSNKISKTGIPPGLFVETKVLRGSTSSKNR